MVTKKENECYKTLSLISSCFFKLPFSCSTQCLPDIAVIHKLILSWVMTLYSLQTALSKLSLWLPYCCFISLIILMFFYYQFIFNWPAAYIHFTSCPSSSTCWVLMLSCCNVTAVLHDQLDSISRCSLVLSPAMKPALSVTVSLLILSQGETKFHIVLTV